MCVMLCNLLGNNTDTLDAVGSMQLPYLNIRSILDVSS